MKRIRITQTGSVIDRPKDQKATVRALGLRKMHHSVEHDASPAIMGMVNKVKHLLTVVEA